MSIEPLSFADQMIQDFLQEHDRAFIKAANEEWEYQQKKQFEQLCNLTYHLLGLRDAEDVDWDDRHAVDMNDTQRALAQRLLDLPDALL